MGNLKKWKEGPLVIDFEYEGRAERMLAWREGEGGREQIVRFEWKMFRQNSSEAPFGPSNHWLSATANSLWEDSSLLFLVCAFQCCHYSTIQSQERNFISIE